jgi:hypothetical protein
MTDQSDEIKYWSSKVEEAKRGQLETVQKSATAWMALFSSLLGVFGAVAFAGGFRSIDELDDSAAFPIKVATTLAGAALCLATYLAAKAAGRLFPTTTNDSTWQAYRKASIDTAAQSLESLSNARKLGLVAVLLVLFGSLFALWGPTAPPSPSKVLMNIEGKVICGKLSYSKGGLIAVDGVEVRSITQQPTLVICPPK